MQFFTNLRRLWAEVFSLKRYKRMHSALAVLCFIAVLPFVILFVIGIGAAFIFAIMFALIQGPLDYLHGIVKQEKNGAHPAVQVVIYLISWPLLFFLYAMYALFALALYIIYFFNVVFGYYTSLGGFKFHLSPLEEDIAKDDGDKKYEVRAIVFAVLGVLLFILALLSTFGVIVGTAGTILSALYELFVFIYVPVAFNHR